MDIKTLLNKDRQRAAINQAAYAEEVQRLVNEAAQEEQALIEQQQQEVEKAARDRQELEELKKRAVDEMAKRDEENTAEQNNGSKKTMKSGAVDSIPQLQTS